MIRVTLTLDEVIESLVLAATNKLHMYDYTNAKNYWDTTVLLDGAEMCGTFEGAEVIFRDKLILTLKDK